MGGVARRRVSKNQFFEREKKVVTMGGAQPRKEVPRQGGRWPGSTLISPPS